MHPSLTQTDHRPWPIPTEPWRWRQSWLDLAFIHYRVDPLTIQSRLPAGVAVQQLDGSAWVGIVPFRMAGVSRRPLPGVFPAFPELNVRTYVEVNGRPGVWFFSLDTNFWPLVVGGRLLYRLPYFPAAMSQRWDGGWCVFQSERRRHGPRFKARYRPRGDVFKAEPGSFEHWLVERYCLFTRNRFEAIARVDVHHIPWPLQGAEVEIEACTLLEAAGLVSIATPPVCHFSKGVDVISWEVRGGSHRIAGLA